MTELAVALFTAFLAGPQPYYPPGRCPETGAERAERGAVIALAIDAETRDADEWAPGWSRGDWAWAAFVKMSAESRFFAIEVHDGRARGDNGRSVCLGQIMGGGERLVGTDYASTRRCVHEVLRHMQLHRERCRVRRATPTGIARVFAGYGTGHSCDPDFVSRHGGGRFARRRAAEWALLSSAARAHSGGHHSGGQ
mgnify:CR=1 FL=1